MCTLLVNCDIKLIIHHTRDYKLYSEQTTVQFIEPSNVNNYYDFHLSCSMCKTRHRACNNRGTDKLAMLLKRVTLYLVIFANELILLRQTLN